MREGIDIDLCENCNLYTPFCEYSCPNGFAYIGSTVDHNGTIIEQYAEKAIVKPYERFEPCLCGCNSREHWSGVRNGKSYVRLECKRCGASAEGKNEADAKRNWNAYIRESR